MLHRYSLDRKNKIKSLILTNWVEYILATIIFKGKFFDDHVSFLSGRGINFLLTDLLFVLEEAGGLLCIMTVMIQSKTAFPLGWAQDIKYLHE